MLGVYNYWRWRGVHAIIVMGLRQIPQHLKRLIPEMVFFIATLAGFFAPRLIFSGNTAWLIGLLGLLPSGA